MLKQPLYLDHSYSMIFPVNNKNQYPVRKTAFALYALRAVICFQAHYTNVLCVLSNTQKYVFIKVQRYYCNRLPLLALGSIYGVRFYVSIACHHFVKLLFKSNISRVLMFAKSSKKWSSRVSNFAKMIIFLVILFIQYLFRVFLIS